MWLRPIVAATVAVSLCGSLQSEAQDGTNVVVIANGADTASVQIAEEYVAARAVPNDQLLRLQITNNGAASRAGFEQQIQNPVDYRQILALKTTDVVALDNLAYHLSVHDNRPRDAYDYAARAAALAKNNPTIDDTLGWIQHLLGDNTQALALDRASRSLPNNAEVQFHAAVVFVASGRVDEAGQLLETALALDPSLSRRRDVRDLREALVGKH